MKIILLGVSSVLWLGACGSNIAVGGPADGSAGKGGGSSSAGASGSAGVPSAGGEPNSAGAPSAAAGGPSAAGAAGSPQDPREAAASYASNDIPCTVDTDCCVVIDSCLNTGLMVASSDQHTVRQLLDSGSMDRCTGCIPPFLQVSCEQNKCVGRTVDLQAASSAQVNEKLATDHCGTLGNSAPYKHTGSNFGCGG